MKIIAGISNTHKQEDIVDYINAGIDEFFVGYIPKEWSDKYGWEVSCNRREHSKYQYYTIEELNNVVNLVHKHNKNVFVTFNAHEYSNEQLKLLLKIIKGIQNVPVDAFIISNLALMLELRNSGINKPINVSIGGGCNTIESILFYHESIPNIGRFILPRKLTIQEIEKISKEAKNYQLKIEAFGLCDPCYFNDEYCFTWHGASNPSLCQSPMYLNRKAVPILNDKNWKEEMQQNNILVYYERRSKLADKIEDLKQKAEYKLEKNRKSVGDDPSKLYILEKIDKCGICAIHKFKEYDIEAVKLPLRGYTMDGNLGLISLVKTVIDHPNATPKYCQGLLNSPDFCAGKNCYYNYPYDS